MRIYQVGWIVMLGGSLVVDEYYIDIMITKR